MLNGVGVIFLILLIVNITLHITLNLLNQTHMKKGETNLPEIFNKWVDKEAYQKSIAYNADKARFGFLESGTFIGLLIYCIYFGGFELIDQIGRSIGDGRYYTTALSFGAILFIISVVMGIPFSLYRTFVIEERYGFNKSTPTLFFKDLFKSLILEVIFAVPLFLGILWFMAKASNYWWIWAWILFLALQIIILILYPVWIAPLFNKFTALEEGDLKDEITKLSNTANFPLTGIYMMDGSKRSTHSNAYFTGIGKKKRIVLFDTLMNHMTTPQILAVLAHEISHYKLHHIRKNLILFSILSLIIFYTLNLMIQNDAFYNGIGFTQPSNYAALIIIGLWIYVLSFIFTPLFSALSRKFEYDADQYAVHNSEIPHSMAEVVAILSKENLSNLNPHPWYSFFYYSHPAPVERVKKLLNICENLKTKQEKS
ncbi:MAG: M48 family metallopeptidase [Thermodesulfobacteriota bacterium]|nr:M48 family metallopeptidase [Thermodesulfobacteriota bacterium]